MDLFLEKLGSPDGLESETDPEKRKLCAALIEHFQGYSKKEKAAFLAPAEALY